VKYITTINQRTYEIDILPDGSVLLNGEPRNVDFLALDASLYSIIIDNHSLEALIDEQGGHYQVLVGGRRYEGQVLDERDQLLRSRSGGVVDQSGEVSIKAPMPGLIVSVPVAEGQAVRAGQTVVILESMKMQNELKAPRDGVVQRISVAPGQSVEQKKVLITIT
jgi:biotin carboxyl carrier protein